MYLPFAVVCIASCHHKRCSFSISWGSVSIWDNLFRTILFRNRKFNAKTIWNIRFLVSFLTVSLCCAFQKGHQEFCGFVWAETKRRSIFSGHRMCVPHSELIWSNIAVKHAISICYFLVKVCNSPERAANPSSSFEGNLNWNRIELPLSSRKGTKTINRYCVAHICSMPRFTRTHSTQYSSSHVPSDFCAFFFSFVAWFIVATFFLWQTQRILRKH